MSLKEKVSSQSSDPKQSDALNVTLLPEIIEAIHTNFAQVLIVTTVGKVREAVYENWPPVDPWKDPLRNLGTLLTLLLTLATTNFHDFLGVNKDFWRALFILLTFHFAGFLALSVWVAITRKYSLPEDVVRQIDPAAHDNDTDTRAEFHGESDNRHRNRPNTLSSRSVRSSSRWAAFKQVVRSLSETK